MRDIFRAAAKTAKTAAKTYVRSLPEEVQAKILTTCESVTNYNIVDKLPKDGEENFYAEVLSNQFHIRVDSEQGLQDSLFDYKENEDVDIVHIIEASRLKWILCDYYESILENGDNFNEIQEKFVKDFQPHVQFVNAPERDFWEVFGEKRVEAFDYNFNKYNVSNMLKMNKKELYKSLCAMQQDKLFLLNVYRCISYLRYYYENIWDDNDEFDEITEQFRQTYPNALEEIERATENVSKIENSMNDSSDESSDDD